MSEVDDRHDEIQGKILHEYDGIEEADNALPNWWLATFFGSIAFGIAYWLLYHPVDMFPTPSEEYAEALASGANMDAADEETLTALAADRSALEEGRQVYRTTCAACHGDEGEGEIGPNLTDGFWLHGGDPLSIYERVRDGITPARSADRELGRDARLGPAARGAARARGDRLLALDPRHRRRRARARGRGARRRAGPTSAG